MDDPPLVCITCIALLRALAARKAVDAPALLRGSARAAWASRWWALLGVAQQSALAATLTEDAFGQLDVLGGSSKVRAGSAEGAEVRGWSDEPLSAQRVPCSWDGRSYERNKRRGKLR